MIGMIEHDKQQDILNLVTKYAYKCKETLVRKDNTLRLIESTTFFTIVQVLLRECSILGYDFSSASHYLQFMQKMQTELDRKPPKSKSSTHEEYLRTINLDVLQKPLPEEILTKTTEFTQALGIESFSDKSVVETLFMALEVLESGAHRSLRTETVDLLQAILELLGLRCEPLDSSYHIIRWLGSSSKRNMFIKPNGKLITEIQGPSSALSNCAMFLDFYGKCFSGDSTSTIPFKQKTAKTLLRDIGVKNKTDWLGLFEKKSSKPEPKRKKPNEKPVSDHSDSEDSSD
ncbi:hypothetical protein HDE_04242 [Halotydeus destructor]|nr:hypothetical protein HDE_04242 [Halotydeus destructor]